LDRRPEIEHKPALDGVRGLAIIAVLLFHGGVSWAQGGYLGVEVFFVLSGFLITSLLLAEWDRARSISLARFWARRARRLLPALFCLVIVTGIHQALVGPANSVPGFGSDGIATLFYFANWHQILSGNGYFAQTALVSPLQHTWSLAIEEQFYIIWPPLLLGLLALLAKLSRRTLSPVLILTILGSVASAVEMAVLFHGGSGLNRVYYGTDTRAQGLLAGAALSIALSMLAKRRSLGKSPRSTRRADTFVHACGLGGMAFVVIAIVTTTGTSAWLYRGGFWIVDLATVALIYSSVIPGSGRSSPTRIFLASWPLRSIGVISYGLYLWHFPIFLWLDTASTGATGSALLALRLSVTLGVSVISFFLVEQPIRRRRLPTWTTRTLAPAGLLSALTALLVAATLVNAAPTTAFAQRRAQSPTVNWAGTSPGCKVLVPIPLPVRQYQTFHTCPPTRVLLVGDSVGLTIGLQLGFNEQDYGILLSNEATVGCGFDTKGLIDSDGSFGPIYAPCSTAFDTWRRQAEQFHPDAIVVEMGWWDSMDHQWSAHDVHLGEVAYDDDLVNRMLTLAKMLSIGNAPVVFLTVPWMDPSPFPDGSPPPAASTSRHDEINSLLHQAVGRSAGKAELFDVSPYLTPSGQFQADVGGSICRSSDGIHLYYGHNAYQSVRTYCGQKLQAALLPYLRELVSSKH
jgi:peptidoglycan/LPS O-acetylase OafA/YrhL